MIKELRAPQLYGSKDIWLVPPYAARQDVHLYPRVHPLSHFARNNASGLALTPAAMALLLLYLVVSKPDRTRQKRMIAKGKAERATAEATEAATAAVQARPLTSR